MSQLTDEAGEKVERILIDVSQQGVRVEIGRAHV